MPGSQAIWAPAVVILDANAGADRDSGIETAADFTEREVEGLGRLAHGNGQTARGGDHRDRRRQSRFDIRRLNVFP